MAAGRDRLRVASAQGVRDEPDLDRGPEEHAVPRLHEDHAAQRLRGHAGLCVGRGAWPTSSSSTWWPKRPAGRRRRRKRRSARRSAPSATTRCNQRLSGSHCQDRWTRSGACNCRVRRVPAIAAAHAADDSAVNANAQFLDNRNVLGLLFMLPAAALLLIVSHLSARARHCGSGSPTPRIGRAGHWVGLDNFEYLVGDALARLSLFNTLFYTVVASVIKFALGLVAGAAAQPHLPFKSFFRAVVLLPFIVPTALSAIAFWWIYDAQFSVVSWALDAHGRDRPLHRFPRRSVDARACR